MNLDDRFGKACLFLESLFGSLPWGNPKIEIVEDQQADALSFPGKITLKRSFVLQADDVWLDLTLAHEIAHQWWGLRLGGDSFLSEPFAELGGVLWVGEFYNKQVERNVASFARGRLFKALMSDNRSIKFDALHYGRNFLAVYQWYRAFERRSILPKMAKANSVSSVWNEISLSHLNCNLRDWSYGRLEDIPRPFLDKRGWLSDSNDSGLGALVAVYDTFTGRLEEVWVDAPIFVGRTSLVSDYQLGPALVGNISSDIVYAQKIQAGCIEGCLCPHLISYDLCQ